MKSTLFSVTQLPTEYGIFETRVYSYEHTNGKFPVISGPPVVLISGDIQGKSSVPVRVHDQCFTSEVFNSLKCDCRKQLEFSQQ